MKKLVGLCLLLAAFIAVNAEDIPQDPVNIADEVEEDRDDIDDEDEEDRDDIDEEDEDEEDEEDRNELIDMNVEDRRNPPVEKCGIRCDAKALGPIIHTGSLRINTPRQCQKHCEKWNIDHPDRPQCQFFRWRGRDFKAKWEKRRRCYLLTKVTDVKKRRGWCWGPRECKEEDVAPTNEVAPTKKVLVMGPVPWTVLSIEDFSLLPSNSTIQDPGITKDDAIKSVSKVIDGTLYLCDTKACRSHDGLGWKIEEGMKLVESRWYREYAADALILSPQTKWFVHGGYSNSGTADVWTPQSGIWKQDPNYKSPYPVDLGCIVIIEGKILQVGGRGKHGRGKHGYSKRVFLGGDEKSSMKENRIYHHCTIFEDRVWVAGGVVGDEHSRNLHKDVEIYDHRKDAWTAGPSLPDDIHDRVPKLKVIRGELHYIGAACGKIFKLNNGAWKKVAEGLPTNKKHIAELAEFTEMN